MNGNAKDVQKLSTQMYLATILENAQKALKDLDDFQSRHSDPSPDDELDAYAECVSEFRLITSSLKQFVEGHKKAAKAGNK